VAAFGTVVTGLDVLCHRCRTRPAHQHDLVQATQSEAHLGQGGLGQAAGGFGMWSSLLQVGGTFSPWLRWWWRPWRCG